MVDLGDAVLLSVQVRDAGDVPTNATTVALTIVQPDGTSVSPVVAPPVTVGLYTYSFVPTIPGRHLVSWVTTGPNSAFTDSFEVRAGTVGIISLAAAKSHLNMSSTRDDDEVRAMIEAVTAVIERHRGEVVARRTVVENNPGGSGGRIVLLHRPVISVASLEDHNGTVISPTGYVLDGQSGILTAPFARWDRPRRVTYVAGYAQVPANYILAAKIILAHLWTTQRIQNIGSAPTLGNQSRREEAIVTPSGMGYAIPHRAIELLGGRPSVVV